MARAPNYTWHVDTSVLPISTGLWAPWLPFALPNVWPFTWHVAVVVDQFSRKLLGFEVFSKEPSADRMLRFLDTTIAAAGAVPKYIITDRGTQFQSELPQLVLYPRDSCPLRRARAQARHRRRRTLHPLDEARGA